MATPGRVVATTDGALACLTFDNPVRRNAISKAMWQSIPELLQEFEQDNAIRAVVITGAGRLAFAAGADISEFETERASVDAVRAYEDVAERAVISFAKMTKPLVGTSGLGMTLTAKPLVIGFLYLSAAVQATCSAVPA